MTQEKPDAAVDSKNASCLDENAICDTCGVFGAFQIGDRSLCPNCYEGSGSCCPEFGKDDLWQQV